MNEEYKKEHLQIILHEIMDMITLGSSPLDTENEKYIRNLISRL